MKRRFETFTLLILQINRSIQRIKSLEMTEFQLKGIHAICLYYLSKAPGRLTQTELARLCAEDKASICRALSVLLERGYLFDSQPDHVKKFKARLSLTAEGEKIAEKVREKIDNAVAAAGGNLQEDERETLYRCLSKINANLKRYLRENT